VLVELTSLRVKRDGRTICQLEELSIESGDRIAIRGANGSGKTTLLRVLAGLEEPDEGRCKLGVPRRDVVFVHQAPILLRGTVLDNVLYGLRGRGLSRGQRFDRARRWLEAAGAEDLARARSDRLSGGELKRVALARALAVEPALLLLDEPFSDLDEAGIASTLGALSASRASAVVLTSPLAPPRGLEAHELHLGRAAPPHEPSL